MEQKHPIAWHVPNLINICIDSVEDGEMTGKIYHCYSEEAIAFSNIIRMIETVEEFLTVCNFPRQLHRHVLFTEKNLYRDRNWKRSWNRNRYYRCGDRKEHFY